MLHLLAQAAPGQQAIQHLAPVPNDIPWTTLALVIWVASAVAAFGIQRRLRWVVDQLPDHPWVELVVTLAAAVLCTAAGAVAGWRVWDVWLGGVVALSGALGSPWIVSWVSRVLGLRFGGKNKPADEE